MFSIGISAGEKILRAVIVYAFLVVALRLAGKRELAQLNSLDFIVLLAVANAVQNAIIGNDNSVTGGLLGAVVFFVLNGALAYVLYRNVKLRRVVEGTPTVLIDGGVVQRETLKREEITMDDLLVACQREGASKLNDVERAVLNPGGTIVIKLREPSDVERMIAALGDKVDALAARMSGS